MAVSHTIRNKLSARTANVINSVRYITIALRLRHCCNGRTGGFMERDVVCGMDVDPAKAAGTSDYTARPITSARKPARTSSMPIPRNMANEMVQQ